MSLRAVDERFLLPSPPATAQVLGDLPGWREGLADAGVAAVDGPSDVPDVVVADAAHAAAALERGAPAAVLYGRAAARAARQRGWHVTEYLRVPRQATPEFLVPVGQPAVLRYFFGDMRVLPRRREWWRNRLAARALGTWPRLPYPPSRLAVATRAPSVPLPVRVAAERAGVPLEGWIASLGPPHAEGRVVIVAFEPGAARPSVVLKLPRLPAERPVTSDVALPPVVARRRPRSFGSVTLGGSERPGAHWVDVEAAAPGCALTEVLRGPFSRRRKVAAVDAVAGWLVEVAAATARPGLTASWVESATAAAGQLGFEPPRGWSDRLPGVPWVFEHGDLWSRNVIVEGAGEFQVVDWVDARPCGVPLRDLVCLLADALAEVDGARTQRERDVHFLALFAGRGRSSPLAFAWIRRLVAAVGVPPELVGPLVTLGWADLAGTRLRELAGVPAAIWRTFDPGGVEPAVQRARLWLGDPDLREGWEAWR